MKPLTDEYAEQLREYLDRKPWQIDKVKTKLNREGYDISSLSTWQDEAAAFVAGVPEGATFNLAGNMTEGYGKMATEVDLPIVGKVQPAREVGRMLGGAVVGGPLWGWGRRLAGIPLAGALTKGLAAGTTKNAVGKVAEVAGAALPEAIVGAGAHGYQEGDIGEAISALPEWYVLGVGSELGMQGLQKVWKARRAGQNVSAEDLATAKAELDKAPPPDKEAMKSGLVEEGVSEAEAGMIVEDHVPSPDDADIPPHAFTTEEPSQTAKRIEKAQADPSQPIVSTETNDFLEGATDEERLSNLLQHSATLDKQLDTIERKGQQSSEKYGTLLEQRRSTVLAQQRLLESTPLDPTVAYYRSMPIVDGSDISSVPVKVRNGKLEVNLSRIHELWEEKDWVPRGGLAEEVFVTRNELQTYLMESAYIGHHTPYEYWRKSGYADPEDQTRAAYVGWVNRQAHRHSVSIRLADLTHNPKPAKPNVVTEVSPHDQAVADYRRKELDTALARKQWLVQHLPNRDMPNEQYGKNDRGSKEYQRLSEEIAEIKREIATLPPKKSKVKAGPSKIAAAMDSDTMLSDDLSKLSRSVFGEDAPSTISSLKGALDNLDKATKDFTPEDYTDQLRAKGDAIRTLSIAVNNAGSTFHAKLSKRLGLDETEQGAKTLVPQSGDVVSLKSHGGATANGEVVSSTPITFTLRSANGIEKAYLKAKWNVDRVYPAIRGGSDVPPQDLASESIRRQIADRLDQARQRADTRFVDPDQIIPEGMTQAQAKALLDDIDGYIDWKKAQIADEELGVFERIADGADDAPGTTSTKPDEETLGMMEGLSEAEKAQQPGLLSKFFGPFSRNGLGRHKAVRWFADFAMNAMDAKQAHYSQWLSLYEQVRKNVGFRDGMRGSLDRVAGANAEPTRRLYQLAQQLDRGGKLPDEWDDGMKEAFRLYRELMRQVADKLDLPTDRRIGEYLHHMFAGREGRYRAAQVGAKMQDNELVSQLTEGTFTPEEYANQLLSHMANPEEGVLPRQFRALKRRELNLQGFEYDLDRITDSYLSGAAEKWFSNQIFPKAQTILGELPDVDLSGEVLDTRRQFAQMVNYILGRPTNARRKFALALGESEVFNRGADWLVENIGGAPQRGVLGQARAHKAGNPEADPTQAFNFLRELDESARSIDRVTGEALTGKEWTRLRARTATKIEDLRHALSNPALSGPVANALYRVQIVSKLGFNMAHGLINLSQTMTNTWPTLKHGYTGQAIQDYLFSGTAKINGRSVSELLAESGILQDAAKVEEFIQLTGGGALRKVQDAAMYFSKSSEQFNRSVALLGHYRMGVDAGLDHTNALIKGVRAVQKTQFPFNRIGTPPVLRGPLARLFFMFKSYPIHQTDFTINLIRDAKSGWKGANSLAEAITNEDVTALWKHLTAYGMLIGAAGAFTGLKDTNVGDRSGMPALEMGTSILKNQGRYGLVAGTVQALAGPFGQTATYAGRSAQNSLLAIAQMTDWADGMASQSVDRAGEQAGQALSALVVPTLFKKAHPLLADGKLPQGKEWFELFSLKRYEPQKKSMNLQRFAQAP